MVWIYGGAFIFGNSSSRFYGADNYLQQDMIIVTFNYRMGPYGKYKKVTLKYFRIIFGISRYLSYLNL